MNILLCYNWFMTQRELALEGIDLVVVQEILGHSKLTITQRYAHPVPQRKLDAINVLNNYL